MSARDTRAEDTAVSMFPASKVRVAKMYYTLCEDPGCGAINDYADDRAGGEQNRRAHIAWHRRQEQAERVQQERDRLQREIASWSESG